MVESLAGVTVTVAHCVFIVVDDSVVVCVSVSVDVRDCVSVDVLLLEEVSVSVRFVVVVVDMVELAAET